MFKNYLKIAIRNIIRHKAYSFINIAGLAIGIACCIIIYLYVNDELSYDKYHSDLDRIYRIAGRFESQNSTSESATISAPVAQVLKENFHQVEKVARVIPVQSGLVKYKQKMFYESNRIFADTELFSILTIPFLQGNSLTALDRPATIVIAERMANKYFGSEDPLGKMLNINGRDYEVTGVVANSPANTHFKYDFILSLNTLKDRYPFSAWFLANFYIYTKIRPNVDIAAFSRQLAQVADVHAKKEVDESGGKVTYFAQPVAEIHLFSHLRNEREPSTNPLYLYIFSAVGLLIMLIASINFMNLTTARSAKRAKEVGLRKVVGAQRLQLIAQFLGESVIISILALLLAILIIELCLPFIKNLSGKELTFSSLYLPGVILMFMGFTLLVGFISGSYPAFFLSSFKPVETIKNPLSGGAGGTILRKVLVVGQFAISIILVIGTMVVFKQLHFMKNQPLGFNNRQKLVIPVRGRISLRDNYESVKNEFKKHTAISGVTVSSNVPGQKLARWDSKLIGGENEQYHAINYLYTDHDFISEYGIKLITGRNFQKELSTDMNRSFIVNMSTVREFGWSSPDEAIGKRVQGIQDPAIIIGVIEDFHYRGLQAVVEPLILQMQNTRFTHLTLTVNTENISNTISSIKETWRLLFPGNPFNFFFLDESFDRQYRSEEQFGKLFSAFTSLGLFIACLGLLGLASFMAEQRTKEIGVRKVLGASIPGIVLLLSKEFLKWVLFANFIAWPFAYYAMNSWLKNFAYRIDIGILTFLLAGVLALVIALLTVGYQAIKAAVANPVESLRYE